jgi:probable rRNA maturation factor
LCFCYEFWSNKLFNMQQQVLFNYADIQPPKFPKTRLKDFIASLFVQENRRLQHLQYVFCSDEFLLGINRQFLNHDYYTDIITFDLLNDNTLPTEGEIYISIERVKDNAKTHNVRFNEELLRVVFHGALHLCGYLDKSEADILLMREKENHYISQFVSES